MRKSSFALQYFKHPRQMGTPIQSSSLLVKAVIEEIIGKNIIELGAGKGPITRGILKIIPPDGKLTCLEIEKEFCEELRRYNDSRLRVINESAEELRNYLNGNDCIISGLPLTSLPHNIRSRILESVKDYRFIQYKYFPSRRLLEDYFSEIKVKRVLLNIPPAVVYVCHNNPKVL